VPQIRRDPVILLPIRLTQGLDSLPLNSVSAMKLTYV
jgi:hypothetical protein